MASYTYCNGVYNVTTYIRNGYKRFHTMNAQCAEFNIDDRLKCWQFVSYNTNICQVIFDSKFYDWYVMFNDNPFGYSSSTTRQVSRWIRENRFPFTGNDVRIAYSNCRGVTPNVAEYDTIRETENVYMNFVSPDVINRNWR